MKKIISFILSNLIIFSMVIPAFAQKVNGVNYAENSNSFTVMSYSGEEKEVTIPSKINSKPVTKISDGAFKGSGVTAVTLPESITEIGNNAFASCNDLAYVTVGENVKKIGTDAFKTGFGDAFVLRCYKGSFADKYALKNNLTTNYILQNPSVTAQALTNNSIHLHWKSIENADNYMIYKVFDDDSKVYLAKVNSTAYDVKSLSGNTQYKFYVRAVSEDGTFSSDFDASNVVKISTICDNPEIVVTNKSNYIKLDWQDIDGAVKYKVYLVNGSERKLLATLKKSEYTYKNLPVGKAYSFFVAIVDAKGNESKFNKSYVVSSSTICEQPDFIANASWISIDVTWKPVEGAKYYGVFYSSSNKSGYQLADYVYADKDVYNYTIGGELSFTNNYKVLVRAFNSEDDGSNFSENSGSTCRLKGFWVMLTGVIICLVVVVIIAVIFILRRKKQYYEVSC